jgi:hypothetical protein
VDPYAETYDDEDELTRGGYEQDARAGRLVAERPRWRHTDAHA